MWNWNRKSNSWVNGNQMAVKMKKRVGVIFGGRSSEHEVSLMSAGSILAAINRDLFDVVEIGITHDGTWLVGENVLASMLQGENERLSTATIFPDPGRTAVYRLLPELGRESVELLAELDVIFPVLHGTFGEDGTMQGLFELADLAYVGAGVLGSALGMDKGVFKDVMRAHGVPVVDSIVLTRREIEQDIEYCIERALQVSPFPIFIKPANLGSSVGISKCKSQADLVEGLVEAARYDRRVMVERGVDAREIEVSVLGNEEPLASLPGEIIPSREFYSYEAKYFDQDSKLLIPAPVSEEISQRAQNLAIQAFKAIDCAGMARVDFLLERTGVVDGEPGELYLNELNTIPGFTKISMYPKLWTTSGLSYSELIDRLIGYALERKEERDRTERRYLPDG